MTVSSSGDHFEYTWLGGIGVDGYLLWQEISVRANWVSDWRRPVGTRGLCKLCRLSCTLDCWSSITPVQLAAHVPSCFEFKQVKMAHVQY